MESFEIEVGPEGAELKVAPGALVLIGGPRQPVPEDKNVPGLDVGDSESGRQVLVGRGKDFAPLAICLWPGGCRPGPCPTPSSACVCIGLGRGPTWIHAKCKPWRLTAPVSVSHPCRSLCLQPVRVLDCNSGHQISSFLVPLQLMASIALTEVAGSCLLVQQVIVLDRRGPLFFIRGHPRSWAVLPSSPPSKFVARRATGTSVSTTFSPVST